MKGLDIYIPLLTGKP